MRLISNLKDRIRNLAGIRTERQIPPAGEKPLIGSNIVRENLRIRLKYPITDDLWKFLISKDWRAVDMRYNKRRYTVVPDKVLHKLMKADEIERHVLHARLTRTGKREQHPHLHQPSSSTTPSIDVRH